ncbi:hypothetical protein [Streptomyces showdoensis]|uniref:Uncharacterized protein n=1 Tax=Streptomyces showdoensis TaxID=68268 RepID=A0A2P2GJL1_STREW|nr:hypothetical protein [Streptomyces showdoensis]KKZ71701.1 hypothetical protein VO63_22150 [Streptomyces showdoensis]
MPEPWYEEAEKVNERYREDHDLPAPGVKEELTVAGVTLFAALGGPVARKIVRQSFKKAVDES